jgi:hypothetical protein
MKKLSISSGFLVPLTFSIIFSHTSQPLAMELIKSNDITNTTSKELKKQFPLNIDSNTLTPNSDINIKQFKHALEEIHHSLEDYYAAHLNLPVENLKKSLSTVKTFAFLYLYSDHLSNISQLKKKFISERLEELFDNLNNLEAPDCPELLIDESNDRLTYEKINFYLFEAADNELLKIFTNHMLDEIPFAFPVIEWSVNLVPLFQYEILLENLNKASLINFIESNYSPENAKDYFKMGWELLSKRFQKEQLSNELINVLRCDMCYPARVSIM